MIKTIIKIAIAVLGYIAAGFLLYQVIKIDHKIDKAQEKYEICEQEKGEAEVIHNEAIMVKDAEKEALQTKVEELEKEVAELKKN